MSWKNVVCVALCAMFASPALAVPTLQITNVGLDSNGNWIWIVGVTPDTAFFQNNPPNGTGGSIAVELGFTASGKPAGTNFVNDTPAVITANIDNLNPGSVIFGWETLTDLNPGPLENLRPVGLQASQANDQIYAALGTTYFLSGGSKPILTVTTKGPSTTTGLTSTLALSGQSLIAQNDPNSTNDTFDFAPGNANRTVKAGDADLSGVTDFTDFQIQQVNFHQPGQNWTTGDFDGSGTTDISDFEILEENFNQAGGSNNSLNAVPTVSAAGASMFVAGLDNSSSVEKAFSAAGDSNVLGELADSTSSAIVTTTLKIRPDGTFSVTLQGDPTPDSAGIASYQFTLGNVTTLSHVAPGSDGASNAAAEVGDAGFTLFRSPNDVNNAPGNPITVTGSQDTATPTPHLIHGFGLENSSFAEEGITAGAPTTQADWGSPLLVATGTWSDVANALPVLTAGSVVVFNSQSGAGAALAQSNLVTVFVPEPSAFALVGLALVGMAGLARRRSES
ncbi:MAG: PEP-CTERM sorting domain-containing protein [Pirellulales bacterium]